MSASIAISKQNYMGDPGIFGFLKGAAKGALGVASAIPGIGGFAGAARNLLFPGDARINIPGASTLPSLPRGGRIPAAPLAMPGSGRPTGGECPPWGSGRRDCLAAQAAGQSRGQIQVPGALGAIQRFLPGGETGMMADPSQFDVTTKMLAGKSTGWPGYHWNKSSYFLMSGEYVPAGTRAVRNRRRNPCNPRAVSRALGRVKAAKRFAKSISHVSIRKRSQH